MSTKKRSPVLLASIGVSACLVAGLVLLFDLKTKHQVTAVSIMPNATLVARTDVPLTRPTMQLLVENGNPSSSFLRQLAAVTLPKPVDCTVEACIALSFDDGPDPVSTPVILNALAKEKVKATFFLVGARVAPGASLVLRMYVDGHDIGNHSWAHPSFGRLNQDQIHQQIDQTQAVIASIGVPAPTMFRAPYGVINAAVLSHVNLPVIMWNVDPKDWHEKDPNKIAEIVVAQAKQGAIILLHDKLATAIAVEQIVQNLKSRFHLVTVTEMLHITPEMRGVFRGL